MSFSSEVREELLDLKMWDNNSNMPQDEQLARLLVRESFIEKGFINDPNKDYHLEILFKSKKKEKQVKEIISNYGIDMKETKKGTNYMLYIKDGEEISAFLALMGAVKAVLKFEEIRVIKDTRNNVNRLVNCETANLNKTINAAVKQIEDIKKLKVTKQFDTLPDTLKELANLRLENPDASYEELRKNAIKTNWKIRCKP